MNARPRSIVIVGLGLIGGSLAAASRKAFPRTRILGVNRSPAALSFAKRKGWIHEGYRDLARAFKKTGAPLAGALKTGPGRAQGPPLHLVVLCTPVDTLKDFLRRLDRVAPAGTIVTDTGSVKGFLIRWADARRWRRVKFIGAHPMAGSHERGIRAARPNLFQGSLTFVTPGRRNSVAALQTVKNFWKKISPRVVVISPPLHDRITGEASHLPHLVAACLVESASSQALHFSAAGFLDTTRIAQGNPGLWVPILLENRNELTRSLSNFESALKRFKKALRKGDLPALGRLLARAQRRRAFLE